MPSAGNSLPSPVRADMAAMDLEELEAALQAGGHPAFHARQIYSWIYARGVIDFEQMTDLSRQLRADLAARFRVSTPVVLEKELSEDGTVKFLLELEDTRRIECRWAAR